jgi:hypothetical protein
MSHSSDSLIVTSTIASIIPVQSSNWELLDHSILSTHHILQTPRNRNPTSQNLSHGVSGTYCALLVCGSTSLLSLLRSLAREVLSDSLGPDATCDDRSTAALSTCDRSCFLSLRRVVSFSFPACPSIPGFGGWGCSRVSIFSTSGGVSFSSCRGADSSSFPSALVSVSGEKCTATVINPPLTPNCVVPRICPEGRFWNRELCAETVVEGGEGGSIAMRFCVCGCNRGRSLEDGRWENRCGDFIADCSEMVNGFCYCGDAWNRNRNLSW